MDFRHFVILMWYYCTITNNLHTLAFSVYDVDGNGMLNATEANEMLLQIYGKYFVGNTDAQMLTKKVTELGRDGVTKLFFIEFCKRNPEILQPAEKNINLLIRGSLGTNRWLRISEHRKILTKDKFVTIWELIAKIQEKAGDDSDLFNVSGAVAERKAKEKKRLKKMYSREYLYREGLKGGGSSGSFNGSSGGSGRAGPEEEEEEVVVIMDEAPAAPSTPPSSSSSSSSSSPALSPAKKKKKTKRSPSKRNVVVPSSA
jgi:hypothetical protein